MSTADDSKLPDSFEPVVNLNVAHIRDIAMPADLTRDIPMTLSANHTVVQARQIVKNILRGQDQRLLVVIGPCSVHDLTGAMDYARRLAKLREEVQDQFFIVMRVYFEKPRTTVGWKGLINDPHLDGTFDTETGMRMARQLLADISELGLPCGTEFLDPIVPQYIADLISWAAIGARTTESQTHRQMASGLSMPVGFKNSTDGSIQIAIDALKSAQSSHHFLGVDDNGRICIVQTKGNPEGHIILRGGNTQTNFDAGNVADASAKLLAAKLPGKLMVDCSHANSAKKHENQVVAWNSLIEQKVTQRGDSPLVGVMIESNLGEGRQDVPADRSQLKYGVSITDACIGWEETARLLRDGAARLRKK